MSKALCLLAFLSCLHLSGQDSSTVLTIAKYYDDHQHSTPSKSTGTVSNGTLEHGHLMPFAGANFNYFDSLSYVSGRAFVNDRVKSTLLETYKSFEKLIPGRRFCFMECSHQHGGELYPHRTHQNGLSVDFMMPLLKDGQPYYALDTLGADHYRMDFDHEGRYKKDLAVSVDFDLAAQHINLLNQTAKQFGLKISKVIIKIEFKDELLNTPFGKTLATSGIYIVKSLDPLINSLHDDHYHVDFELTGA